MRPLRPFTSWAPRLIGVTLGSTESNLLSLGRFVHLVYGPWPTLSTNPSCVDFCLPLSWISFPLRDLEISLPELSPTLVTFDLALEHVCVAFPKTPFCKPPFSPFTLFGSPKEEVSVIYVRCVVFGSPRSMSLSSMYPLRPAYNAASSS